MNAAARWLVRAVWSSWPRRVLTLSVVVGGALRVVWILYAARFPQGLHDPIQYLHLAQSLAAGHGYRYPGSGPTAYYPVGYPAILGAWFWVMQRTPLRDHWIMGAAAMNLVLSTSSIALAGVLGRRLVGPWVGAVSAVIVALFPSLVMHSATILTETTFNFVFLVALLVLCWQPWSERAPSWTRLSVFAVLLGVSIEIRPIAVLVVPMVLVAFWRRGGFRQAVTRFAIVAAVVVAVMVPWAVRNEVVMHAFAPVGTTTGDNLCIGNSPDAQGHFALPAWCFPAPTAANPPITEVQRNSRLTHKALQWAVHHPAREVALVIDRTRWEFDGDADAVAAVQSYGNDPFIAPATATRLSEVADRYFEVIGILALAGIPLLVRGGDRRRLLLLLCIVAVVISVWPFFGDPRFHVPINVLMPIPAATVLVALGRRLRPH